MVTIRAAQPSDAVAVRGVVTAAFGAEGSRVAGLVDALDDAGATAVSLVAVDSARSTGSGGAAGSAGATDSTDSTDSARSAGSGGLAGHGDGGVVGHVQLSRSWLDASRALVDVLVLSPLSVAPSRQRQGIGGSLVRAALSAARDLGVPAVFLEGAPDYYPRLGFERGRSRGFESPSTRIPDAAFQVFVLDGWEDWMTGRLVYRDPFWAQDCVGLRGSS